MLMSSSPGILDGDDYHLKIEVQQGAFLQLHTQSYQRLFTMRGSAQQQMIVHMQEGSTFTYLPHPTVPHVQSAYKGHNKIYMANNCTLAWGEILTSGRTMRDEPFSFSKYQNITEVYCNEKLIVKENQLLLPHAGNITGIGMLEGFTHQSSFLLLGQHLEAALVIHKLRNFLQTFAHITFGVTSLATNGIVVRILGYKAEQLYNIHLLMLQYLQNEQVIINTNLTKSPAYAN